MPLLRDVVKETALVKAEKTAGHAKKKEKKRNHRHKCGTKLKIKID